MYSICETAVNGDASGNSVLFILPDISTVTNRYQLIKVW